MTIDFVQPKLGTLSSYNKFNNNCCRDSLIVSLTNCGTSIFGGFAIFPALGYLSHIVGRPVPNVVEASFGLAFQVYPEAISKMPGAPVWSILFFIMLITLGKFMNKNPALLGRTR